MMKTTHSVYWYRNALRFHDNPSLLSCCKNSDTVLHLYIIDPNYPFCQTQDIKPGCIRANFVMESIREMDEKLQSLTSRMVVIVGKPERVLPEVMNVTNSTDLYYEQDPAAPVYEADQSIMKKLDCRVHDYATHTMYPLEKYLKHCKDRKAPATFGGFSKIFQKMKAPKEVEDIKSVPPLPESALQILQGVFGNKVGIPTLPDLGYSESSLKHRAKGGIDFVGGEDAGLKLLNQMMSRKQWVASFEKPKTSPNALTVDTTGLSPYVKHGCLSPRRFFNELTKVYSNYNPKNISKPPVSLHGQLMWREYNTLMGYTTPCFDQMTDNPVARQIPWDDDPELLAAWRESRTGYPYIDAIMTQLRETGWIHHLARHSVACFLTRGDLWQSWEDGAAVFEELLIDADWSINNFNWQWLSCTAHFYQYFRCYSPVAFGKKTDPNGDYIRKWLPQFKNMPKKYIYEPWEAPLSVQKKFDVIVGENYPEPIVDHKLISKSNMSRMKEAYDAQKAGQPMPQQRPIREDIEHPPKRARIE